MVKLTDLEDNFFGLVLKASDESTQRIEFKSERPLHVTMASLDTSSESDEYVPIIIQKTPEKKFLICTLSKKSNLLQQAVALEINAGESLTFLLDCKTGVVNLTGYYLSDQCGHDDADGENQLQLMEAIKNMQANAGNEFSDEDDDDEDDDDDDEIDDDDSDDDEEIDDEEDEDEEDESPKRKNDAKQDSNKKLKNDDKAPKLVSTEEKKKAEDKPAADNQTKTLAGGVIIKDTKVGTGPVAKKGKQIQVYYQGKLKQNGKQFDACIKGKPFKFRLGAGEVIKGWDVGFEDMKVGGKRQLIIPAPMAYGNKKLDGIPANSTLVFDVELKAVS